MEIQEPENGQIDSVDQPVQVEQEETRNEENINKYDHLNDPIASPPSENQIKSSDEKSIHQEVPNDDLINEVRHIDFIFGDSSFILEDCVQPIEIQMLMNLLVQSHIQAEVRNHKRKCLRSTSS